MSIPMRSESLPKAESLWTSPQLDHLGKAILCTVAYADVFDYPLTAAQIHRYLMGTATSRDRVNRALRADPWVRQRLEEHEGYYTLPGREDLVKLRQNRARVASGMWPREALALAQAGRHVLATDVSPEMAAQTANRARAADLSHRVRALCVPAGGLAALRPDTPFDGAYASFGALNCEPHLGRLTTGLRRLLKPEGAFVCSVMARWCPFEIAWFLLHLRPAIALRRLQRGWQPAPVAGRQGVQVSVSTRYLSVRDLAQVFEPGFHIERTMALPLLLPPPYLDDLYRKRRSLFERVEPWERRLRECWPFRHWGDHLAAVLRVRAE